MAAIEQVERPVYRAPTKKRCYFSARAAANAEARAQIERKHPSEKVDCDEFGRIVYPGYHWSGDEWCVRAHKRLMNRILRAFRQANKD